MNDRHDSPGQQQSQQQGQKQEQQVCALLEKTPRTTADPAADGQSIYDYQDDEVAKPHEPLKAQVARARGQAPDSNAM
jgi:hypothetical protein